jgi:hypothetical protein
MSPRYQIESQNSIVACIEDNIITCSPALTWEIGSLWHVLPYQNPPTVALSPGIDDGTTFFLSFFSLGAMCLGMHFYK